MTEKEKIRGAFSHLHVSEDTLSEVMNMIEAKERKRQLFMKRLPAVAAACVVVAGAVTVYAANNTAFFKNVFGTGIEGQQEHTVTVDVNDGTDVPRQITEEYPAVERVDVDEEKAQALVGDYVTAVGQSITLDHYTFTLEDIVMDENGIGALTVQVENPDGLGMDAGEAALETFGFRAAPVASEETYMDFRTYLVSDSLTPTSATYVYYVVPFEMLSLGEAMTISFGLPTANADGTKSWHEKSMTIPVTDLVPAQRFSAEGITANVSAVGMLVSFDFAKGKEKPTDHISIQYTDGSEYVIKDEHVSNVSVSSLGEDFDTCWIAFNRLADLDNISKILVDGYFREESGEPENFALTLTKAE